MKPGNIILTKSGIKLLDFGLAKFRQPPLQGLSDRVTQEDPITAQGDDPRLQYMARVAFAHGCEPLRWLRLASQAMAQADGAEGSLIPEAKAARLTNLRSWSVMTSAKRISM